MTTTALRRIVLGSLIGLLAITVEVAPPISAQTTLLPYATVSTLPQTAGEVWPADFNEDGITDLVSGGDGVNDPINHDKKIEIAIGNGDGTFKEPIVSATIGWVRAVADLNRDGFIDVIAASADGLLVLPGNGDGTLQAARSVTPDAGFGGFVLAAHLNDDQNRDLVLEYSQSLLIFAGRGDFTFDGPVQVPLSGFPQQATTGDFDGNGLLDIAVAHTEPAQLTVLMNEGMLQFTPRTIALPKAAMDLTSRDLDADGALDLVVAASTHPGWTYALDGFVYVLTGGGNGTFALTGTYATAIGPMAIVLGDFTRDGRLDVATANRSYRILDDGCVFMTGADSVSILAGNGDGTLGTAATFALGPQTYGAEVFGDEVDSLNTSDLNRDGHLDLIVSDGKLLITAAPRANRPPVVDAGPDEIAPGGNTIFLRGSGTDPDGHLLTFRVTDQAARIDYPSNVGCVNSVPSERYELTMTASDGFAEGSDTVVHDFSFTDPGPEGWTNGDIGNVARPGDAVYNAHEDEFTITGSGADIWNRADEFHFTQIPVSGDFSISALVHSVENVNRWTKAGLMIREGLAPGARHASLFVTPTTEKGTAFQRRLTVNGLSVHTAGPVRTAPLRIMLKRTGDLISAYYQAVDAGPWVLIARDTITGLADTVNVGLAVTSHLDGTTATAKFRQMVILAPNVEFGASDIGAVGIPGTGTFNPNAGSGDMQGSGADIWGTADAFYFFRQWWTADGTATVRVQSLQHTHRWTKMGLMFRETADPGSRHVMLIVSAGMGVAMQYRAEPGGISSNVALTTGAAPEWLRLRRSGNTFTGYASEDGNTWRTIGSITLPLDLDTFVGVALTSHNNGALARGVFDNLTVVR